MSQSESLAESVSVSSSESESESESESLGAGLTSSESLAAAWSSSLVEGLAVLSCGDGEGGVAGLRLRVLATVRRVDV